MMSREFENLGQLRERMLGFSRRFVAERVGLAEDRLAAVEAGQTQPSVTEIELLARFYGVDEELLEEAPIVIRRGDGIELLALNNEIQPADADTKTRVIRAANAARDLVELETALGLPSRFEALAADRIAPPKRSKDDAPHHQGAGWGKSARNHFHLRGTVPSMRDFMRDRWPQVRVLYADLGRDSDLSGLTFVDRTRGPTVVLNLRGRNEHPLVRRFSLAHELAHLIIDLHRGQPLALLSSFKSGDHLAIESRANAFAMRFLCPEDVARRAAEGTSAEAIRTLVDVWGIHYSAARLYLRNVCGIKDLPPQPPMGLFDRSASQRAAAQWAIAEEPAMPVGFPLPEVAPERRTFVAELAARRFVAGDISRGRFCEYLGVSRLAEVERVADHFGLTAE